MGASDESPLLEALKRSRLLSEKQLTAVADQLAQNPQATPAQVLEALAQKRWLTTWQVTQLKKGHTGFVLARYRMLNPVGKGGMGHVFRALDTGKRRIVAVKVMARKLKSNETLVSRFQREIRASSRLNSPHIIRALDAGRVGTTDFLVMEFVDGDEVEDLARRVGRLPAGLALEIARQAAIGLQHAHEQHMVHRDIKPANLMIHWGEDGSGTVKLMDMGLVRLRDDSEEERQMTRTGQVMGTPDYMSPEQGWDTNSVDIRSDVYSLGCAVFRMISGKIPFPGDNPLQTLMARCSRDAPELRTVIAGVPDAVNAIVHRMMARDPENRFQTPSELIIALEGMCTPLTREAVTAAAEASADPSAVFGVQSAEHEVDEADASYQRFLKEMQSGADVNLMAAAEEFAAGDYGDSDSPPSAPTFTPAPRPVLPDRRRRNSRSMKGGLLIVLLSLLTLATTIVMLPPGDPPPVTSSDSSTTSPPEQDPEPPDIQLGSAPRAEMQAGREWVLQVPAEGTAKIDGDQLYYELSDQSPAAAAIDRRTGEIRWNIPELASPEVYVVGVYLMQATTSGPAVVDSRDYEVQVLARSVGELPQIVRARVPAGRPFVVSMAAEPPPPLEDKLAYVLMNPQEGMEIDAESGLFSWIPTARDAGPHEILVALKDYSADTTLATGTIRCRVVLGPDRPRLPRFETQTAVPGTLFRMTLARRPLSEMIPGAVLIPAPGAPPGVSIDPRSMELQWFVPADARGTMTIPLVIAPETPDVRLPPIVMEQQAVVTIRIQSDAPTAGPTEEDVERAAKELREVYRRELATARDEEQEQLASAFLEQSWQAEPGARDLALLNLAEELAGESRALHLALRVRQRKNIRYGIDELDGITELWMRIDRRRRDADYLDALSEEGPRLALLAAGRNDYNTCHELLRSTSALLRETKTYGTDFPAAVRAARDLTSEIKELTDTASIAIRQEKLITLLEDWQFEELMTADTGILFFQSTGAGDPLPDNGRSSWSFKDSQIRCLTEAREGFLGAMLPTGNQNNYIIRFELGPESNCAAVLLNAAAGIRLECALVELREPDFGRIQLLPGPTLKAPGIPTAVRSRDTADQVEIRVLDEAISIRLNGQTIHNDVRSALPEASGLGLLATLNLPATPKLDIRRLRRLNLP